MANYLVERLVRNAEKYQTKALYRFKRPGHEEWSIATWKDFQNSVMRAARALYALGLKELDLAILCGPNIPNLLIAEYACFFNRMGGVPIYLFSSADQFAYISSNCSARIAFVGSKVQYELAKAYDAKAETPFEYIILADDDIDFGPIDDKRVLTWSKFLSYGDDQSLQSPMIERARRAQPDDMASLIYTSGTTGEPKGVVLNHTQFEAQMKEHLVRLEDVNENELSLCFLPMSHVFEKAWLFFCLVKGLRIAFNYDPRDIERTLLEVKPNLMCCVPRFWEKVYSATMSKIEQYGWFGRQMIRRALWIGYKTNLHYRRRGKRVPGWLRREYAFWDKRLFAKVRHRIGLPEPNIFPTAGAVLSPKICTFMRSIGIDIVVGYGMTETTATVTCFPKYNYEVDSVGTPLNKIEVKIDNSGEILVKGPTVTPGYYNDPQANAEAFTPDGWLRTGDAGFFDDNGALVLSARKKELFKTSNGKYISPQQIESLVATSPYIDEVAVIGEGRKYVSALIVPNFVAIEERAKQVGLHFETKEDMCASARAHEFILKQVQEMQKNMAGYEQIKKVALIPHHFSVQRGEVTNTLKKRRGAIERIYKDQIDKMYPDEKLDKDALK